MRAACIALISGRAAHPASVVARMITADDVKKAKGFVARMNEIRTDATRVALLSLIPRRKEARKQQQDPPVTSAVSKTG